MEQHAALDAMCRRGRLVITPNEVSFQPFRRTRRTPGWTIARGNVGGVTSRLRGVTYELTIHARDGGRGGVSKLNPPDAFAAVRLLGYGWPAIALQQRALLARGETTFRCKWGRLEIGRERVGLRTQPWHQRHAWSLPRAAVSGVGYHGAGGAARVRDLVIYTRAGTAFPVYDLAPADALAVVRALGLVRDAYPVGHAPVHEPPEPESPLPGAGSGRGVVVVPAPGHSSVRPKVPSFWPQRVRKGERDETPAHAAVRAEPPERRPRPRPRLQSSRGMEQEHMERLERTEREEARTGTRGFNTVAGMLAATTLLAAATAATFAGRGLPESWDLLSAHPAGGSLLPIMATRTGNQAPGGSTAQPTLTAIPTATTATATATPGKAIPAVVSRPKPTPTPRPTATPRPTPVPTATPLPTATPTPSPSPSPSPSPVPLPSPSPMPTATVAPTLGPTATSLPPAATSVPSPTEIP